MSEDTISKTSPSFHGSEGELGGRDEAPKLSIADRLLLLCQAEIEDLWHDQASRGYATVRLNGHLEHIPIGSRRISQWARNLFLLREERTVRNQVVRDVLDMLDSRAVLQGPEHPVHVRVVRHSSPDHIIVDLGGPDWEGVLITPEGWSLVPLGTLPVRFLRPKGMEALPTPVQGGQIQILRPHLNLDEQGFILAVAWMLASLAGVKPYPILVLNGEQGSAKSSTTRVLQSLVDPHAAGLRGIVREGQDLFIAARNSHLMCFDNLSSLSDKLADDLCRISSGASFTTRQLFRDEEEVIIPVARPMILNGIPDLLSRGDLADRCLNITLAPIPGSQRLVEREYQAKVASIRPQVLGGIFTAMAGALARWDQAQVQDSPRMADFARWIVAAEPDLPWESGAFMRAYRRSRREAAGLTLEGNPFAQALMTMVRERQKWNGNCLELLKTLESMPSFPGGHLEGWPRTAKGVGNAIRRMAPALRAEGFQITQDRQPGGNRDRLVHLVWDEPR